MDRTESPTERYLCVLCGRRVDAAPDYFCERCGKVVHVVADPQVDLLDLLETDRLELAAAVTRERFGPVPSRRVRSL